MTNVEKLTQATSLSKSIQDIQNVPRFQLSNQVATVVTYGSEHVYNFASQKDAQFFVDSINSYIDKLFTSQTDIIEKSIGDIFYS